MPTTPVLHFTGSNAVSAQFVWADIDLTTAGSWCYVTHREAAASGEPDMWMSELYSNDISNHVWEIEHSGGPIGGGELAAFADRQDDSGGADATALAPYNKTWEIWYTWPGGGVNGRFHWRNLTDAPSTWHHFDGNNLFNTGDLDVVMDGVLNIGGFSDGSGSPYTGSIGHHSIWNVDLNTYLSTNPIHTKSSDLNSISPTARIFGADLTSTTPASIADLAGHGVTCTAITASLDSGVISEWTFDGASSPPTNTSVPVLSTTGSETSPVVGDTLSMTNGTWTGSPTGFTYIWRRSDIPATITGATSSSYTIQSADVGHEISGRIIATNAAGDSSATVAQSALGNQLIPPSGGIAAGGDASVSPSAMAAVGDVLTPAAHAAASTSPTAAAGAGDVATPSVSAGASESPAHSAATGDVPGPSVAAGSGVSPGAQAATGDVPTPIVQSGGSQIVSPGAMGAAGDLVAPVVHAGAALAPGAAGGAGGARVPRIAGLGRVVSHANNPNYVRVEGRATGIFASRRTYIVVAERSTGIRVESVEFAEVA